MFHKQLSENQKALNFAITLAQDLKGTKEIDYCLLWEMILPDLNKNFPNLDIDTITDLQIRAMTEFAKLD